MRLKAGAIAAQSLSRYHGLLAYCKAGEAADDHILTSRGSLSVAQLLNGLAVELRVVHRLLEQHDRLKPRVQLAVDDPLAHVLGLVGGLLLVDASLRVSQIGRHVITAEELDGRRGCDLHRHLAREGCEIVVLGHEVRVAVDLYQHAHLRAGVHIRLHRALGRRPLAEILDLLALPDPQDLDRLLHVALGLGQGLLAVHHPCARPLAQRLDVLGSDLNRVHDALASTFVCLLSSPSAARGSSAAGGCSAGASSLASTGSGCCAPVDGVSAPAAGGSVAAVSTSAASGSGVSVFAAVSASAAGGAAASGAAASGSGMGAGGGLSADAPCGWAGASVADGGVGVGVAGSFSGETTAAAGAGGACAAAAAARAAASRSAASRVACSCASRAACSSASRRARASASMRAFSSASLRARSSSARNTACPSETTWPIAWVISAHERIASSLPGITKSIPSGSQLVSTRPMIGMRRRWASLTAIASVLRSITNIASGTRCMFFTPPRFARSLARSACAAMRSRVGSSAS